MAEEPIPEETIETESDVIGIIQMRSKERGVYAHSHLELAERIGNQVAGGIANAQLYSQTLQAEQELRESEERFR